jgi:hypothetical protein
VLVVGSTGEAPKFILFEHAYLFRGPALAELSAYEYASLVDVVHETKGSKKVEANDLFGGSSKHFKQGRVNSYFNFDLSWGSGVHRDSGSDAKAAIEAELAGLTQRLRSKEVTVRMPPIPSIGNFHTKKTEKVERQRDIFSRFALSVLCPFDRESLCPFYLDENGEQFFPTLDFAGLRNWIYFLRASESNIDKARLFWLENMSVQMTIPSKAKIAFNRFRNLGTVPWTEEEISLAYAFNCSENERKYNEASEGDIEEYLRQRENNSEISKKQKKSRAQTEQLYDQISLFPTEKMPVGVRAPVEQRADRSDLDFWNDNAKSRELLPNFFSESSRKFAAGSLAEPIAVPMSALDDAETRPAGAGAGDFGRVPNKFSVDPFPSMNEQQQAFALEVMQYLNQVAAFERNLGPRPIFHRILLGPGGTGKSYVLNCIIKRVTEADNSWAYRILVGAPTGCAAALIRGKTIHRMFALKSTNPTSAEAIAAAAHCNRAVLIVLDELSMVPSRMLCDIDAKLQQYKNSKTSFGGVGMVLMGDFNQLEPVSGHSLIESFLQKGDAIGHYLCHLFRFRQLTVQMRASDPVHAARLDQIRSFNPGKEGNFTQQFFHSLKPLVPPAGSPPDASFPEKYIDRCRISIAAFYTNNARHE